MADTTTVHIGENSPEQVAFKLLETISHLEGKDVGGKGASKPDRAYVLKLFHECLHVVKGYQPK